MPSRVDPVVASLARRVRVEPWGRKSRRGFTLIELLITISIIAIMASMVLFALYSAQETAKAAKTKALIVKLDAILKAKWESYRTRRVPITIPPATPPQLAAQMRLDGLRDLMRMELPDRWTDIAYLNTTTNPIRVDASSLSDAAMPAVGFPASSIWLGYFRKVSAANVANNSNPSLEFQGAECLYLIVMSAIAEEGDAREVFRPDDVKDVDGDGFPEFVDGWGQPIRFLRWAPGFQNSELQIVARGTSSLPPSPPPQTIIVTGTGLSGTAGAYVGGAIIATTGASNSLDVANMARITGYQPSGANSATITYSFPSGGTTPTFPPQDVVITNPDPFDPSGVYASTGPPTYAPPFAVYPLIYSAGPDKVYGIVSDGGPPVAYAPVIVSHPNYDPILANLNPFVILTAAGIPPVPVELIGNARNLTGEPNYVPSAWLDNLHNHMLGTK